MNLFSKIKKFLANKEIPSIVSTNTDGLLIVEGGVEKFLFQWSVIKEIFVYKRDIFSVDLICIGFRIDEEGTYYEIHEDIQGYKEFITFLESKFQDINKDWFIKVAFPPFATNTQTIWGESKMPKLWEQ